MFSTYYSTGKVEVYTDSGDCVLEYHPTLGKVWHTADLDLQRAAWGLLESEGFIKV